MKKRYKIVFANGDERELDDFNSTILMLLEEKYSPVITVNGKPTAFFGMTKKQIADELNRINKLKLSNK